MSDIGLLIFDEAHHSKSDHPYNQLMQVLVCLCVCWGTGGGAFWGGG